MRFDTDALRAVRDLDIHNEWQEADVWVRFFLRRDVKGFECAMMDSSEILVHERAKSPWIRQACACLELGTYTFLACT